MEKEIKLPLKESFTVTFAPQANAIGILLNAPEAYPWLLNCFIQLTCWGNQYLDYYDFNHRICPILFCQKIRKELLDSMGKGVIDFVVAALEKNYYVMLPVETKYIREYDFDAVHELLVYGHKNSKIFYIADTFSDGKYRMGICSAQELSQATLQIGEPITWRNGFEGTIELWSYQREKRAKFELHRVIESIQDYLSSVATKRWYVNNAMWDADEIHNRCFGMQCYEGVFYNIKIAREKGDFDSSGHRALFLEWEHKKIMTMRLKWMQKDYFVPEKIISDYRQLEEQARLAMFLKLKYDITKKEKLCDRIEDIYEIMREKERETLGRLLDKLVSAG